MCILFSSGNDDMPVPYTTTIQTKFRFDLMIYNSANFEATTSRFYIVIDINDTNRMMVNNIDDGDDNDDDENTKWP